MSPKRHHGSFHNLKDDESLQSYALAWVIVAGVLAVLANVLAAVFAG